MNTSPTDTLRELVIQLYKQNECTGTALGEILAALPSLETGSPQSPDVKRMGAVTIARNGYIQDIERQLAEARTQRDRLAEVMRAATVLIAAKGRHNTMLAYNGLRDAVAKELSTTE